jgi:hypothetical protein
LIKEMQKKNGRNTPPSSSDGFFFFQVVVLCLALFSSLRKLFYSLGSNAWLAWEASVEIWRMGSHPGAGSYYTQLVWRQLNIPGSFGLIGICPSVDAIMF